MLEVLGFISLPVIISHCPPQPHGHHNSHPASAAREMTRPLLYQVVSQTHF